MSLENGKLPLASAQQYVRNWLSRGKIEAGQLRGFTIRKSELEFLLLQMDITSCDAVRFYLGDRAASPADAPDFSLIMTGVQGFVPSLFLKPPYAQEDFFGKNQIVDLPGMEKYFTYFPENTFQHGKGGGKGDDPDPATGAEYVFDFAYPCPSTCQLETPTGPSGSTSILLNPPPPFNPKP